MQAIALLSLNISVAKESEATRRINNGIQRAKTITNKR